jgi:hypothetical protein
MGWVGRLGERHRTGARRRPPSPGLSPPNCRGERRIRSRCDRPLAKHCHFEGAPREPGGLRCTVARPRNLPSEFSWSAGLAEGRGHALRPLPLSSERAPKIAACGCPVTGLTGLRAEAARVSFGGDRIRQRTGKWADAAGESIVLERWKQREDAEESFSAPSLFASDTDFRSCLCSGWARAAGPRLDDRLRASASRFLSRRQSLRRRAVLCGASFEMTDRGASAH